MDNSPSHPPRSYSPMIGHRRVNVTSDTGALYKNILQRKYEQKRSQTVMGSSVLAASLSLVTAAFAYYFGQNLLALFAVSFGCLLGGFIPLLIKYGAKSANKPTLDKQPSLSDTFKIHSPEPESQVVRLKNQLEETPDKAIRSRKTPKDVQAFQAKSLFKKANRSKFLRGNSKTDELDDDSSPKGRRRSLNSPNSVEEAGSRRSSLSSTRRSSS